LTVEVTVVGGGVIGLSVAWYAARAGFSVSLRDLGSPHAGSRVAGGMLAPVSEAWPGEEAVTAQGVEALALWPDFAAALNVGLFNDGTLLVGTSPGDLADLRRIEGLFNNPTLRLLNDSTPGSLNDPASGSPNEPHVGLLNDPALRLSNEPRAGLLNDPAARSSSDPGVGLLNDPGVGLLNNRAIRQLEPALGPSVRGGMLVTNELAVDNRALLSALRKACAEAGVLFESTVDGHVTVIAAGAWSGQLHPALKDVVRPVKGEILRLSHRAGTLPPPTHTIRALVSGRPVYLVPRNDGLVVGATQYEAGFDTDVSVAGVRDLLRDAETVLPGIAEYALTEAAVGFRAGSPDNVPIVRWLEPGVIAATGHHRNGLLLAPHTAREVLRLLEGGSS